MNGFWATLSQQHVHVLIPEAIMVLGLLVLISMIALTYKKSAEDNNSLMTASLIFIVLSFVALIWEFNQFTANHQLTANNFFSTFPPVQYAMFQALSVDMFGFLIRALLLIGAGLTIAISHHFLVKKTYIVADFYVLILGATVGGMFLTLSNDLILLFVALETLSITSYVLAGYLRRTVRSAEASLKYLIYGGISSAVFLFGLSLVYGLVGTTNFQDVGIGLSQFQGQFGHPTIILAMVMIFAAFAFKLSLAPFHMWAPDVYDGAPTPVAAFLSVVSKTAAFAITIRALVLLFPWFSGWVIIMGILAVLSMTLGNFVAVKQRQFKRLLAYSTIAHAGYMLLGLFVGTQEGVGSLVFYLLTYAFMNFGAFACVIAFQNETGTDEIDAYNGLFQKRPGLVFAFSICLLSLAGIPITAGFFAKFFLFQAVAAADPMYLWFVVAALLNSTVSLYYYMVPIRNMVVKEPSSAVASLPLTAAPQNALTTSIAFCVITTLLLGIFASPFFRFSQKSVEHLVQQQRVFLSTHSGR